MGKVLSVHPDKDGRGSDYLSQGNLGSARRVNCDMAGQGYRGPGNTGFTPPFEKCQGQETGSTTEGLGSDYLETGSPRSAGSMFWKENFGADNITPVRRKEEKCRMEVDCPRPDRLSPSLWVRGPAIMAQMYGRVRGAKRRRAQSWWLKKFDSTMGFPGEGHTSKRRDIRIRTNNVTSWNTLKRCFDEDDLGICDIICVQEHQLCDDSKIEAAKKWAADRGYVGCWTKARRKKKGGTSSGTAILWRHYLHVRIRKLKGLDHRASAISVRLPVVGELWIAMLYGDVSSCDEAGGQLKCCYEQMKEKEFWGILGDFNLTAGVVREIMNIMDPHATVMDVGPTCYSGGNQPTVIDYGIFFRSARFLVQGTEAVLAAIPTHRPVNYLGSINGLEEEVWTKPKIATAPI